MKLNLISDKGRIMTIEQLMEASNMNPKEREIIKAKINKYEGQSKDKVTSEITITELFQIFAEMKPKHKLLQPDIKEVLMEVFGQFIPTIQGPAVKQGQLLGQIIHTDLHRDRYEHKGKKYMQEVNDRTMRLFETLLLHKPERLVYANLGDARNSDGGSKTTAGTLQHNYLSELESFKLGLQAQSELIKTLATELPIDVVYIGGNHDLDKLQNLAEAIKLYFSKSNNVTVDSEPMARKYKRWGDSVIGYAHGDGIKDKQILPTMQSETKMGKFNYFNKGHIHQRLKDDKGSLHIDTYPSPAWPSQWERANGRTQRGGIYGQVYDKRKGKVAEYKE